jgi:hypothetical protein
MNVNLTREERVQAVNICLEVCPMSPFERTVLEGIRDAIATSTEDRWIAANQHVQPLVDTLLHRIRLNGIETVIKHRIHETRKEKV